MTKGHLPLPKIHAERSQQTGWQHESQTHHFAKIRDVIDYRRGLILITGPMGTGKTVLLLNALQHAVASGRTVRLENTTPIEYDLEGSIAYRNSEAGRDRIIRPNLFATIADLRDQRPVEHVIGVQTDLYRTVGGQTEIAFDALAPLATLARDRLVIAEFQSVTPLPDHIFKVITERLESQGIPLFCLHLGHSEGDLKIAC